MEFLQEWGYLGLFIGSFLAATVIPFSSDILLVGLLIAGGNPYIAITVATVGNWLGGMVSYYMGYFAKWQWLERWFRIKESTLIRQQARVERWGSSLAFMSWLPGIGDVLAIALGFYKVNVAKCAIYMFIGKGSRFVAWALIYYWVAK